MRTALAALLLTFTPAAAPAADLGQRCAIAHEAGDTAEANRIIAELTTGRHILSEVGIRAGQACVEAVLGGEYEFNRRVGHYEKVDVEARAAAEAARREAELAAKAEEEDRRQEARAKQEAVEAEAAERQARLDELQLRVARQQAMREAAVRQRLDEACTRLYKRAPDEAILNELCYRQFLATGLPG